MIELAFGAAVLAAGAFVVEAWRRRRKRASSPEGRKQPPPSRPASSEKRSGPRGLRTGDVLLYADGELWLAGSICVEEAGSVLRLFPTPGAERATWVAQLDREGHEVALLRESDEVPDGRVPDALPIGGRRLSLRRRGLGRVRAEGEHLPHVTERADYVILGAAGGRVLVVVDFRGGDRLALHGESVNREMLDLLPAGDAALQPGT